MYIQLNLHVEMNDLVSPHLGKNRSRLLKFQDSPLLGDLHTLSLLNQQQMMSNGKALIGGFNPQLSS